MSAEILKLILVGWAFIIVLMAVVWWISWRIKNAGIVDVAWSFGFAPVAILYALCGPGYSARRLLVAAMVVLWSARLGAHLLIRVEEMHPKEDQRYHALRVEWGKSAETKMFGFFQVQGLLLIVLSMVFLLPCLNLNATITFVEIIGAILWLIAWVGESLSDHQLKKFKADPGNHGKVCDTGLWHYSRHPNYFFEWLVWVAFFVFALGSPWGWISIYCPVLMLFFLLKVTGIPMTEELSVKNKGETYRQYQKTTSAFVPWFRKGDTTHGD